MSKVADDPSPQVLFEAAVAGDGDAERRLWGLVPDDERALELGCQLLERRAGVDRVAGAMAAFDQDLAAAREAVGALEAAAAGAERVVDRDESGAGHIEDRDRPSR